MGQVMKLANGSVETIMNERDFEDILDKYLGTEAADYFHSLFKDYDDVKALQEKVEELESKVEDLEFDLDNQEIDLDNQKDKYKELEAEYEEYRIENPRHRF